MREFPLLNGDSLDLDHALDGHPEADGNRSIVLHEDFAEESLPWWLSYQTDNGPATPTYDGLVSGNNNTQVTLSTGTTNTNDVTYLQTTFALNWDEWRRIRFYVWGGQLSHPDNSRAFAIYGDGPEPVNLTEGWRGNWEGGNGAVVFAPRVYSGGVEQNTARSKNELDATAEHVFGVRLYENTQDAKSTGHSLTNVLDGEPLDNWVEGGGFPTAANHRFYVGVQTKDTSADRSVDIDGIRIELEK